MDEIVDIISWEDVKGIKFHYNPLNTDYIEVTYKTLDDIELSIDSCIPTKVPPDEDVVVKIPSNVKVLSELPLKDINKIKEVYKNEKTLKIYSNNNQQYILYPHIESYIENEDRLIRWEQFKKDLKEKWEVLKPKEVQQLKKQLILKQKEAEEIQNQILKLI